MYEAPKLYERVESWEHVQRKAHEYLAAYNERYPSKVMNLVLFDDAMMHLMRINRSIQQKRSSAMLVGVGGSGKQSLTRLAAFISGHYQFQITITKTYGDASFLEAPASLKLLQSSPVEYGIFDSRTMRGFVQTVESSLYLSEDLRELYLRAGQKGQPVTWIFTDAEVKSESFLEYMNSILATGEVVGLYQKDEKDVACNEVPFCPRV